MNIFYTQNNAPEPEARFEESECDSFKAETHPVTGKFTLHLYEHRGSQQFLKEAVAGVSVFRVQRP